MNMEFEDYKHIISSDEHRTLELKKTTGELIDGMHTACAFLNTDGGWLIFGVTPTSLKIVGQQVTDNTQREIANALSKLEPAVNIFVDYVEVPNSKGNKLICMHFDGYTFGSRPYTYDGRPYYKVESTTKIMPREMFEERLRMSRPAFYSWEQQIASGLSIKDLSEQRIRGAIRLGVEGGRINPSAMTEPIEIVLDKLQLLSDGKPNNGALALFGTNINDARFNLRMARFRGTNKNEFVDNQKVKGNFFELLDAGMAFFFKWLALSGKIIGLYREEHLEIPYEALREALINALCHRNYEHYNICIGIAIYDDRIEIESPGKFPPQITPENIKLEHGSFPHNPIMADFLFKTTFLESWGSGARRIIDACKAQNLPEPIWEERTGYVVLTFNRPSKEALEQLGSTQVEPKFDLGSTQVRLLVEACPEGYLSVLEMMNCLGIKGRKNFRENYLKPAIESGAVEAKFPDSPCHPHQRYKLTKAALLWKQNQ